ncbi:MULTISPECIES: TRAP transporter small permease [Comamonas]|jgi:TRAP-type C4-dicarboxylate transport system, small permease component|uniref:TRAP transporter small permease protein n=1 Tax=Comamonas terrigena TaxID=32013 RepID=A0A2A7USC3_COMTR|nr:MULTISPECIES: TRAP transporter small permease [Comamonas]MBD9533334.1 TRAP transporter small permease [Comamonas sp. CMM01]MBP7353088.1 TRAP transporter small permease [Comamonas sp.]PEH88170.1 TRAP transporter small permease [Comamonas terrigena]SUY87275.1 TRAP-type C4-dicarboxylate transport system, small permease component [Comamonas terrigena]
MRKFLDGLYGSTAWLAGLGMIGILVMVLLTVLSRVIGFNAPGTDAYAGYAMAGCGFMALASTLKKGEHIRVTLLLGALKGKALKTMEVTALVIATTLAGFLAFYSTRLVFQSWEIDDISVGIDATPMWIPQIFMALGTIVFFIAFCDELVLELMGKRKAVANEDAHHE